MIPEDWIPQRRSDGETIGYIEAVGEGFRPRDLLGRPLSESTDWLAAEELLEAQGLGWLAEPQLLHLDPPRRVRIVEVTPERLRLVDDDFGASQAVGAAGLERWELPLPLTVGLTPVRGYSS